MMDRLDQAPCGYFSFFDDGSLYEVNATGCRWLGYEKEELPGKNVESLFTLPTRIFYQTHFFPLVKMQGGAEEIFLSLATKDRQQLPVLLNAKRMGEEARPYTACSFLVVANRQKFEDELVAARKEAETALRENTALLKARSDLQRHTELLDAQVELVKKQNDELKQLNHVITHSLREPLRKMMVYAEKLTTYTIPDDAAADAGKLLKASALLRTVVSGLQEYVWLNDEPASFAEVDLLWVVRRAEKKIYEEQPLAPLVLQTGELPVVEADSGQLELFFYHLFLNALRFKRGEQAQVSIVASALQQNRFRNLADKYRYDDFVKLEISDQGTGFDPAQTETVFELFKKAQSSEGIGLGLALCRQVAQNHSGILTINTQPNEGTTVRFVLPVKQNASPAVPKD